MARNDGGNKINTPWTFLKRDWGYYNLGNIGLSPIPKHKSVDLYFAIVISELY